MAPFINQSCVEAIQEDNASYTLPHLIQDIHNVLGPDGGLDSEHIDHNEIIQLMQKYGSNSADWEKYTLFDRSRPYTRNLIDDGNGKVSPC
jgi:cysteine dioxygenase